MASRPLNLFELLAECSVAFSGFAAVYTGVRGSTGARGSFRAWSAVGAGFLAFLLSMIPLLLRELEVEELTIWRVSSLIGLVGMAGFFLVTLRVHRRLSTLGHTPQSSSAIVISMLVPSLVLLAFLVNLLGYPWPSGSFLYGLGIALILTAGMIVFLLTFWLPLREVWEEDGP
jgi:hypothetical protein